MCACSPQCPHADTPGHAGLTRALPSPCRLTAHGRDRRCTTSHATPRRRGSRRSAPTCTRCTAAPRRASACAAAPRSREQAGGGRGGGGVSGRCSCRGKPSRRPRPLQPQPKRKPEPKRQRPGQAPRALVAAWQDPASLTPPAWLAGGQLLVPAGGDVRACVWRGRCGTACAANRAAKGSGGSSRLPGASASACLARGGVPLGVGWGGVSEQASPLACVLQGREGMADPPHGTFDTGGGGHCPGCQARLRPLASCTSFCGDGCRHGRRRAKARSTLVATATVLHVPGWLSVPGRCYIDGASCT